MYGFKGNAYLLIGIILSKELCLDWFWNGFFCFMNFVGADRYVGYKNVK
ncbi:hypothetical protein C8N37_104488 [Sphingobacterium faecium]|nr:hypothetical protein C8N37_104488 [Sphingobacterium faecium]